MGAAYLLKQIPDTGGTHTDKQLDKLRGCTGEEGHSSLACNSLSQQGFACAGGAYQQAPLGDLGAQLSVLVWVLQEVNNLLKLQLGLFYTLQPQKQWTDSQGAN